MVLPAKAVARGKVTRGLAMCDKGIYLKKQLKDKLIEHKQYIDKHGEDLPEIRN